MATKLNPRRMGPYQYSHKRDDLKRGLLDSLQALGTDKVDLFYLHAPDVSSSVTCCIAAYLANQIVG
jgi:aflatoxin B1 aldehyde reductase